MHSYHRAEFCIPPPPSHQIYFPYVLLQLPISRNSDRSGHASLPSTTVHAFVLVAGRVQHFFRENLLV